jgi:hypothetical protein
LRQDVWVSVDFAHTWESSLQRAASLPAAKGDYVAAVGALQEWVALSGLSNKIKGL